MYDLGFDVAACLHVLVYMLSLHFRCVAAACKWWSSRCWEFAAAAGFVPF